MLLLARNFFISFFTEFHHISCVLIFHVFHHSCVFLIISCCIFIFLVETRGSTEKHFQSCFVWIQIWFEWNMRWYWIVIKIKFTICSRRLRTLRQYIKESFSQFIDFKCSTSQTCLRKKHQKVIRWYCFLRLIVLCKFNVVVVNCL